MLTLGTQRDLTNDMLIKGIIDSVVTVNQFYQMLPFKGIEGNALAYNRESTIDQVGLVDVLNTGHTSINKKAETFSRHSTELTTIIGDAQVNGLVQAVGSDYHDATAVQVAAKAKGLGRRYMDLLIHGNEDGGFSSGNKVSAAVIIALLSGARVTQDGTVIGTADSVKTASGAYVIVPTGGTVHTAVTYTGAFGAATNGEHTLVDATASLLNDASKIVNGYTAFDGLEVLSGGNIVAAQANTTGNDRLAQLDVLIDRVHDKDGMVDYMMMNSAGVRKITAAFRQVGLGFDMMDVKTSSGGVMAVQSYRGVPIFRNDFVGLGSRSGVKGGDTNDATRIFVGTLDDGSMTHGICGLTAKRSAGMQVQKLGAREDVDADITRVKWYCGLAHFSELGLIRGSLA